MQSKQLIESLSKYHALGLYRQKQAIHLVDESRILVKGKSCINFSSNDYLGIKMHPAVSDAFIQAVRLYGLGSGSSPLLCGYSKLHEQTEACFAKWLNTDACVIFSSGYSANISIISALCKRSDYVFADKLCHASILDGIQLSRAKHIRYKHNNIQHFSELAAMHPPNLIVTESVFSMEGDIAPVDNLINQAKQYHAGLIIDDSHAMGVLGASARGVIEHSSLRQNDFSCVVSSLGKAFNAMGAIVAGRKEVIESIVQFARAYCYSTAIAPAICGAIHAALKVVQEERWRLHKLHENIQYFTDYACDKGLNLVSNDPSPIKSILLGHSRVVMQLQQYLLTRGYFVSAIRPPTVASNNARLRLSLSALHTQGQISQLIDCIHGWLKEA